MKYRFYQKGVPVVVAIITDAVPHAIELGFVNRDELAGAKRLATALGLELREEKPDDPVLCICGGVPSVFTDHASTVSLRCYVRCLNPTCSVTGPRAFSEADAVARWCALVGGAE